MQIHKVRATRENGRQIKKWKTWRRRQKHLHKSLVSSARVT